MATWVVGAESAAGGSEHRASTSGAAPPAPTQGAAWGASGLPLRLQVWENSLESFLGIPGLAWPRVAELFLLGVYRDRNVKSILCSDASFL